MHLLPELIHWYWSNTVHKYHVAKAMMTIIMGLSPTSPNPPSWRSFPYFLRSLNAQEGNTFDLGETIQNLKKLRRELLVRLLVHDFFKYTWKEARWFIMENRNLRNTSYGSPEYKAAMERIKPGIEAHYKANRHHPEWHKNGIKDMTLADEIEMICDWLAASRKHRDGNILISIHKNQDRFGYNDEQSEFYTYVAKSCMSYDENNLVFEKFVAWLIQKAEQEEL